MYVEQAFFQRFWREANEYDKNLTQQLVSSGQLEFVNGGWCMHDEAATHYVDMIDQTTLGHRFIVDEFGTEALPTIGWQIGQQPHQAHARTPAAGHTGGKEPMSVADVCLPVLFSSPVRSLRPLCHSGRAAVS